MFTVGPYSWLTPVLVVLGVVLVAVVVGLIWRGRDGADRRPGPVTYFLYGMSLVCLVVVLVGTGIGVHATAQADRSLLASPPTSADFGNFPPCPTGNTATPSTTIPPDQLPCIDFGQSGSLRPAFARTQFSRHIGPSSAFVALRQLALIRLVGPRSDRNQYISAAVTAGLFALAGLIGYLVVWPRSRRTGSESGGRRRTYQTVRSRLRLSGGGAVDGVAVGLRAAGGRQRVQGYRTRCQPSVGPRRRHQGIRYLRRPIRPSRPWTALPPALRQPTSRAAATLLRAVDPC